MPLILARLEGEGGGGVIDKIGRGAHHPCPKSFSCFRASFLKAREAPLKKRKRSEMARPQFRFWIKIRVNPIYLVNFFMVATPTKGQGKKLTHGKSKKKSPESLGGKGSRESKQAHKSESSTPTTVLLSSTSAPTLNLFATSSQLITSNGTFCSTIQTLHLDDLSTAPTFEVKMSAKTKKPAYSVNFCNSVETLAGCL
jgi:hypothetical protein